MLIMSNVTRKYLGHYLSNQHRLGTPPSPILIIFGRVVGFMMIRKNPNFFGNPPIGLAVNLGQSF